MFQVESSRSRYQADICSVKNKMACIQNRPIHQVKITATKSKQNTMIHFHSFKMDPALKYNSVCYSLIITSLIITLIKHK